MTQERLIKGLRDLSTEGKLRVYEAWKVAGKNATEAAKSLGISRQYVSEVIQDPLIVIIDELECVGVVNEEPVPTPEWLQGQFKRLYDKAVIRGDEEAQDKYLKRIMEFKGKFGEMVSAESARIAEMDNEELAIFTEELVGELKNIKDRWGWANEGTTVSEPRIEGNPVTAE